MVPSTGTNTTSTPADLVELGLGQRVVQMPEMGDAHVGHLVDEDRVAGVRCRRRSNRGYWSARCARVRP